MSRDPQDDGFIRISNLQSGRNGHNPPSLLRDDECVEAINVDWHGASVARRRFGSEAIDMSNATVDITVSSLHRHVPSSDSELAEMWAIDANEHINRLSRGYGAPIAQHFDAANNSGYWTPTTDFLFGKEDFVSTLPCRFDATSVTGPASIMIDTSGVLNGNNSAQVIAFGAGSAYAQKDLGSEIPTIFLQTYLYLSNTFSYGAGGYFSFLTFLNANLANSFAFSISNTNMLTVNGAGISTTSLVAIPTDSKVRLEVAVTKNTSTGRIRVWLNNTVSGSPDYDSGSINSGASPIEIIRAGLTDAPNAVSPFWIDDVVADDTFIGTRADANNYVVSDVFSLGQSVKIDGNVYTINAVSQIAFTTAQRNAVVYANVAVTPQSAVWTQPASLDSIIGATIQTDWTTIDNKLMIANQWNTDNFGKYRLHLWDPTANGGNGLIRRAGIDPAQVAPIVTEAGSGSFANTAFLVRTRFSEHRFIPGFTDAGVGNGSAVIHQVIMT